MKIMLEKTDAQNPLTVAEIISELNIYGISAERKAIYNDLDILREFGIEIETIKSKTVGYYVASRQFDLTELKLLVDAVQSSRFITLKKSQELIQKLSSLTSTALAKQLKRQIYVSGRAKSSNESALYNVDAIYAAINDGKKISFKYFDYDLRKNRVFRKNGSEYKATPIAMTWSDDKYYLIALCDEHREIRHYRVDRMYTVTELDDVADVTEPLDMAKYNKRVFGMYNGELVCADLCFDNSLVNIVLDQFGSDIFMIASEGGYFNIKTDISISPVFLGWMFQLGRKAHINGPEKLITAMQKLIDENLENYRL